MLLAYVARLEHEPLKLGVVGSSPTRLTIEIQKGPSGPFLISMCQLGCGEELRGFAQCPVSARKRRRIVYVPPGFISVVLAANVFLLW